MLDCGRQEGADIMEDQILFINLRRTWPTGVVGRHVGGVGCGGYSWPRGVMIISGGGVAHNERALEVPGCGHTSLIALRLAFECAACHWRRTSSVEVSMSMRGIDI